MNNSGGETLYSLSEVCQIMIVSCIFHYIESTEEFPHANSHQQRYWDRVSTVTLLHNSFVFIFNEFLLQCCAINRNFKATHRSIFDGFFPSRQLSYSVDDGSHISGTVELDLGQAVLVGFHDPLDLWSEREGTRLSLLFWRLICISLSVSKGFWEQCWSIGSESNRFWDQETDLELSIFCRNVKGL